MSEELKPLTKRQKRFCREYIVNGLNGKQAALAAGYDMTDEAAAVQATRMLRRANVIAFVKELQKQQDDAFEIKSVDILRELYLMATMDITEAYDDAGFLKPLKDIPPHIRKCIASIESSELFAGGDSDNQKSVMGINKKLKFWSKEKALELLGKYKSLFNEKVDHKLTVSLEDLIAPRDEAGS